MSSECCTRTRAKERSYVPYHRGQEWQLMETKRKVVAKQATSQLLRAVDGFPKSSWSLHSLVFPSVPVCTRYSPGITLMGHAASPSKFGTFLMSYVSVVGRSFRRKQGAEL